MIGTRSAITRRSTMAIEAAGPNSACRAASSSPHRELQEFGSDQVSIASGACAWRRPSMCWTALGGRPRPSLWTKTHSAISAFQCPGIQASDRDGEFVSSSQRVPTFLGSVRLYLRRDCKPSGIGALRV